MDCIFCTTPYQIMSAVSIAISGESQMDLYIISQFAGAEEIARRVEKLNLFHALVCVDARRLKDKYIHGKRGTLGRALLGFSYLSAHRIADQILIPGSSYQRMYTSNKEFFCRMVYLSLSRKQQDLELIAFDDGEGTYASPKTYLPGKADTLVRKLLFHGKASGDVSKLLVYMPELFHRMNPDIKIPVEKIHGVWEDSTALEAMNTVFGYTAKASIEEPVILIDTVKTEVLFAEGQLKKLEQIYQLIFQRFPENKLMIKRHPRDRSAFIPGRRYYQHSEIPFECLCMNTDMDKKVLIALSSTAVVQPKMISGQEPMVILLNQLILTENPTKEARDRFYHMVKESYRYPDRFLIPESMEELSEAIEKAAGFVA